MWDCNRKQSEGDICHAFCFFEFHCGTVEVGEVVTNIEKGWEFRRRQPVDNWELCSALAANWGKLNWKPRAERDIRIVELTSRAAHSDHDAPQLYWWQCQNCWTANGLERSGTPFRLQVQFTYCITAVFSAVDFPNNRRRLMWQGAELIAPRVTSEQQVIVQNGPTPACYSEHNSFGNLTSLAVYVSYLTQLSIRAEIWSHC